MSYWSHIIRAGSEAFLAAWSDAFSREQVIYTRRAMSGGIRPKTYRLVPKAHVKGWVESGAGRVVQDDELAIAIREGWFIPPAPRKDADELEAHRAHRDDYRRENFDPVDQFFTAIFNAAIATPENLTKAGEIKMDVINAAITNASPKKWTDTEITRAELEKFLADEQHATLDPDKAGLNDQPGDVAGDGEKIA